MTRTLTASVLAVSIAFGGMTAAPAQAGNNKDIGRLIVGVAAIALIAKAVEENNRRRRVVASTRTAPLHYHAPKPPIHIPHPPKPQPVYLPVYQPPVYQTPVYQTPVYQPPVAFKGFLPSECQFDVRRGEKSRSVYSKLCLSELMVRAELVPEVCEDRVTTSNGRRTQVYDSICLLERGYVDEAGQYN